MIKPIKCQICRVAADKGLIIVPFGRYCNPGIEEAKPDAIIDFIESWRKTRVILTRKCRLTINSGAFTFMLKHIYGEQATWNRLKSDWEALCINEGLGAQAFSDKEALLLEYRIFIKEEYEAEQEAQRVRIERLEKAMAREKLIADAKKGIYNHKDILK